MAPPRDCRQAPELEHATQVGSGHFPHTEEPERFVRALLDFVATTEPLHLDEAEWRAALTAGPATEVS